MYLFFDTETTGLPLKWKAPTSDVDNWPRVVQLAWVAYDSGGNKENSGDVLIKPEGFTIPVDASRIHGITTERALAEGLPLETALNEFSRAVDCATCLVAHNISFDTAVLGAEYIRATGSDPLSVKKAICTKEASTDFCAIPGNYGYKWPKLSELYRTLFGTDFEDSHNARADVEATARCFWELKKRGVV